MGHSPYKYFTRQQNKIVQLLPSKKNTREWDKEKSMIITNASDINKVLLQLQKQIQQLERRIKVLENK